MLDTQDVIVTTSPSVAKLSTGLTITTPVSSTKLLETHAIFTDSSAELSEPSAKCQRDEDSRSATSHCELMVASEQVLKTRSA